MTTTRPPRLFGALVLCGAALVPGCERTASTPPTPAADPPTTAAADDATPHVGASSPATTPTAVLADATEPAPACECSEAKDASCTANGVMCCWAHDPCCEPCC